MRCCSIYFLMLLCLTAVLTAAIDSSGCFVNAQEQAQHKFRKIYVPEDLPDSWPAGKWQPISSKKYFQLLEDKNNSTEQLLQAGMSQVQYRATFQNGQLVAGKLTGRISNPRQSTNWQNLGKTNFHLQSLKWKQGKTNWGTNSTGDLFVLQQQKQAELEGEWSLHGRATSQGTRFDFKFLRATQSTLQLTLPVTMQLQLSEDSQAPFFAKDISPKLREWTIHLSSHQALTVFINPLSSSTGNRLLLARQIHLLTLGVSEQKFVTDFQVEMPGQKESQIHLFLPDGFKAERLEIQQEKVSTWKRIASSDENSKGVLIPIDLRTELPQTPISIRLSGELTHLKNHQLATTFPQIMGAVQAETQVTVVVESPLQTIKLSTKSLQQIDARVGPGIRDTWTYTAIGTDPAIDISVAVPTPRLQADQIIYCTNQEDETTELKHLMFWTTNDEGFFTGKFRLFPGYEVREIVVLSDAKIEVPSNWNIRTEKDRDFLLLHLPNQLAPGQKLAVSITLRPKSSGNQQPRISLPALQLINGEIQENLLLVFPDASIKQFPANAAIKSLPFSQLKEWSSFWKELAIASDEPGKTGWFFKDISTVERVIIKPGVQTESQSNHQATSLPSDNTHSDKVVSSLPKWSIEQDFPLRTPWGCRIKAILHQQDTNLTQVQIEYFKQNKQELDFPDHLKFSEEITLHSMTIDGHFYAVDKTGMKFSTPVTNKPIESVIINYSTRSQELLPLPVNNFQISYDQFLLCLPGKSTPSPNEVILLWQKFPDFYSTGLEVDPAFAESQSTTFSLDAFATPFDSLLTEYIHQHGYNLYEAHFTNQLPAESIRLEIRSTSIPWFSLFWLFLTVLVLALFLNILFHTSHQIWLFLSVLLSVSAVFLDHRDLILILLPTTAALFIAAQLPGSFLKWLLHQSSPSEDSLPKRGGSLRHLLTGLNSLLLIAFWLNTQVLCGQPIQENKAKEAERRADLLIPVKSSLLTEKFQGLQPADYPEIIYLSEKFAGELKDLESRASDLNEILFRSANYDVVWSEKQAIQIHCQFRIIDVRKKQANSFRLPLSGIKSLPALKATVNGESASINPLPDGSGLEIPLPQRSLSDGHNAEPREFLIELDVIPQNKALAQGTQFTLGIPPIAQSQMAFQFPEKFSARLLRSPQEILEVAPQGNNHHVYQVGASKQFMLILDTATARDEQGEIKKYESLQTSMLTQLSPHYLSLKLHTKVQFAANANRTMKWKLPPQMAVRSVHALANIDHRLSSLPENHTLLELNIPDSNSNEQTFLVDLILPLDPNKLLKEISLPSLIEKPSELEFEQQWQLALQAGPGFELSNVEFPSIATSRITPAVFSQNWPEQNPLSQFAICHRLQKPSRFHVKLNKQESELTVIAEHEFLAESTQIYLHSQYQIDVIGTPLWAVTCNNPVKWELDSVQMSSGETIIPVRVMKQNGEIKIAFSERMEDACLLDIHWKQPVAKLPIKLNVTPPRIPQTLYYRENLNALPSDSGWQGHLNSDSSAPTQNWMEKLEIDADDSSEMPEVFMQTPVEKLSSLPPVKTLTPTLPATQSQTNDLGKILPENINKHLKVKIDHTLWREKNNWLGETLIMLPISRLNDPENLASSLQIHLPKNMQILGLSHHQSLKIKVADNTLSIKQNDLEGKLSSHFDLGLILIQWRQPRTFSWNATQSLSLPNASEAKSSTWRLIDSHSVKNRLSQSMESWKKYLLTLSELGLEVDTIKAPINPSAKPDLLFQQVLLQLPEQSEGKVFSALEKLPRQSWNQPLQLKMNFVQESGFSDSPLAQISIVSENYLIRYAILALSIFWGWGMWRVTYAVRPGIRKRHLALCSFLLIGLLAVLMIN